MNFISIPICAICGETKARNQVWFLVAENRWEDKVTVLQWHEKLAKRHGIYRACGVAHVQELVVHWMTTGSLDYPFALADSLSEAHAERGLNAKTFRASSRMAAIDIQEIRQIGELAVHRESIGRALRENPDSLQIILDELLDALEREAMGAKAEVEPEEQSSYATSREI
jgi:hypothetical protein